MCFWTRTMGCSGALMHELNQPRVLRRVALVTDSWLALENWPLRIFKLIGTFFTLSTLATLHCSVQVVCANNVIHGKHLLFPSRTRFGHCSQSPGTVTVTDETTRRLSSETLHSARAAAGWDERVLCYPRRGLFEAVTGHPTSDTSSLWTVLSIICCNKSQPQV